MAKNSDLVATILDETLACQDPKSPRSQQRRTGRYAPFGPDIIGPDGGFPTTDLAMGALAEIADRFRKNDPLLTRTMTRDTIRLLASTATGDIIQELAREPDRTKHWRMLRDRMHERARQIHRDLMHYVPVWLFVGQVCDPFAIGPVRFLPRPFWPDVIQARRGPEPSWLPSLRTLWAGGRLSEGSWRAGLVAGLRSAMKAPLTPSVWLLAVRNARKRSRSRDVSNAQRVARTVHPDQWVACIEVNGFEPEESRRRGVLAARVALDTVRLAVWGKDRRLIRTAADSSEPLSIDRMNQAVGEDLAMGWHFNRPGVGGPDGMAQDVVTQAATLFGAAGECIAAALDPKPGTHGCPDLADRWFNAVHWFGRACLADADFVAVVMLIISLDVLSGGLQDSGILELVARLTGMPQSHPVLTDGTTLSKLIDGAYKLRSEVAHGSVLAVHSQLDEERNKIEELASVALAEYVIALSSYAKAGGADDRDAFRSSLPAATP